MFTGEAAIQRLARALDDRSRARRSRLAVDEFLTGRGRVADAAITWLYFSVAVQEWGTRSVLPESIGIIDAALAEAQTPTRVLDIGTGTGTLAARAAVRWPSARVDAVDMAWSMVRATRRLHPSPNLFAHVSTSRRMPFADGAFDLVCAMNCMPVPGEVARLTHEGSEVITICTVPFDRGSDYAFRARWSEFGFEFAERSESPIRAEDGHWYRFARREVRCEVRSEVRSEVPREGADQDAGGVMAG